MEQTQKKMLIELVNMYKLQVKNYEGLSETNNKIIEKQKEYIKKLEALLEESKDIIEKLMIIAKDKVVSL